MNDITLHQLRLLREVAQRGTIAAAAEAMGYTASAVSQQLSGLERSTGIAVLERIGRNVRLTDAGRELVRHARDLISGMEAAQVAIERVGGEARGTLDLTVYESVASTILPVLLMRLAEQYPDIHLRTRQMEPDDAIDALAGGDLDMAFTIDYRHSPAAPRADVIRFPVLEDYFQLVLPEDDPIEGETVTLDEVANRRFISSPITHSCGRCLVTACREAGFEPNIIHELDDYPTTLRLIAAGQGVSLVPYLGLALLPPGVRTVRITPRLSRTIELAYRTTSAERPAIVAVRDLITAIVADMDPAAAAA